MKQLNFLEEQRPLVIGKALNTAKNYGVERKHLNPFEYADLENIHFGLHNGFMPHKMLLNLNEPEALAIFWGIGVLKKIKDYKNPLPYLRQHEGWAGLPIEEIVGRINAPVSRGGLGAYQIPAVLKLHQNGFNPHSTKPGELRKRIATLDNNVKRIFLGSFAADCVYHGNGIYDPNADGINKRLYADTVFKKIKEVYKQNTA